MVEEKFYTVPEVSAILRIDRHVVTKMFSKERGTVILGNSLTVRGRRKYRHVRIPQSVVARVLARMSVR